MRDKIQAIKKIRELCGRTQEPYITINTEGIHEIRMRDVEMSRMPLKDAKDFIEEVMDIGVKTYLEGQLRLMNGVGSGDGQS